MRRFSHRKNILTSELALSTPNLSETSPNIDKRSESHIIQALWWFWQVGANWGNFSTFCWKWGEGGGIKFLKIRFRVRGTSPKWDPIHWSRLDLAVGLGISL